MFTSYNTRCNIILIMEMYDILQLDTIILKTFLVHFHLDSFKDKRLDEVLYSSRSKVWDHEIELYN